MVTRDQLRCPADGGVRGERAWHDNGVALVRGRSTSATTAHGERDARSARGAPRPQRNRRHVAGRVGPAGGEGRRVRARLDLELTPDITLIAYLRWWTDVELVEQVEDGIITATTRKAYVGQVNNHIICYPEWGSLRELSGAKVHNWQTWLRANGRTANTRKAALSVLKTALQKAWKFELIPTNPARLVDPPRVRRQRRDEITVEHVRALLAATAGSMRLGALLQTACHVPYRPGELFGAEWDAMDLDEGLFDVRANLVRHEGRCLLHAPRPTSAAWSRLPGLWSTRSAAIGKRRRRNGSRLAPSGNDQLCG
jgi:integrase